jgi:hypothetical protein
MKNVIRTIDMSKKGYNKPAMRVVKLQHEAHLLSGSKNCTNPNPASGGSNPSAKIWHWQVD